MFKVWKLFFAFILVSLFSSIVSAQEKTGTGFFYPLGRSTWSQGGGWMERDNDNGGDYFEDEYHIGEDMAATVGSPVYAISAGTITYKSAGGWGTGNFGIVIRHKLSDGSQFSALYGHIRTSKGVGSTVNAGESFATIGPVSTGNHIHFGIHPGLTMPVSEWGRRPDHRWADPNGFVDPINWIRTRTPEGGTPPGIAVGQGSSRQGAFIDAFNRNGGSGNMGNPVEATRWAYNNNQVVQEFRGGSWGDCTIFDDELAQKGAYVLRHGMRAEYYSIGGADSALGAPRSDERAAYRSSWGTEGAVQDFEAGHIHASPYGTFWTLNQIDAKYGSLSGTAGPMGFPKTDEFGVDSAVSGLHGYVNVFEGGHIFHTNELGTYSTQGNLNAKYAGMNSMGSVLGFPVTDGIEVSAAHWRQNFEGGSIYHRAQGTWFVSGAVKDAYNASGAWQGNWGWPTSDNLSLTAKTKSGGDGFLQYFDNGHCYNSPLGAYLVSGSVRDEYQSLGWEGGVLSYPIGNLQICNPSPSGTTGDQQNFESGAIYRSRHGAIAVYGNFFAKYAEVNRAWSGGTGGILGFPGGRVTSITSGATGKTGTYQGFEDSCIYANDYGTFVNPPGAIRNRYRDQGWESGLLGFVKSDPYPYLNGTRQDFEGGSLTDGVSFSLAVSPSPLSAGSSAVGTVTLPVAAPDGGVTVALSSSNAAVATVPASVSVPAGATSATFAVAAPQRSASASVEISAALLDLSRSVSLQVVPAAPQNIRVSHPSGLNYGTSAPGAPLNLTANYSDPDGAANIRTARIDITSNPAFAVGNALFATYEAASNKLFLHSNAAGRAIGGFAPGSNNTISNEHGSLNCAQTTVSRGGNGLTVRWNFTPSAAFAGVGHKNVFLQVTDNSNLTDGWDDLGDWLVRGQSNAAPVNVSVSPLSRRSDAGQGVSLSAVYSDADGALDIQNARIDITASPSFAVGNALLATYESNSNKLFLYSNASGAMIGGFAPGSDNAISNEHGTLDCAATTVSRTGNKLTVNWRFVPAATWTGLRQVFLQSRDSKNVTADWTKLASWSIGSNAAPVALSIAPGSGSSAVGVSRILTATYSDENGAASISSARIDITPNPAFAIGNAIYASYEVSSNKLFLFSTASNTMIGGFAPGSNNLISNQFATLDCAATTVVQSGNRLTINWAFKPTTAFAGSKNVFTWVKDQEGALENWKKLATWTVIAPAGARSQTDSSASQS